MKKKMIINTTLCEEASVVADQEESGLKIP